MVKPKWLAMPKNKEFDIPSRIGENGEGWSDDEDQETVEVGKRKCRAEKATVHKKMRTEQRNKGKVVRHTLGHTMRTRSQGSVEQPIASGSRITADQIDPSLRDTDDDSEEV